MNRGSSSRSTRSIQNGALVHWSPSQITTYRRCPARWGFEKIDHLRDDEEPTGAQNKGTAIHGQAEGWFDAGVEPTDPSLKKALASGQLPARGALEIEAALVDPVLLAVCVPAKGFIDLRVPPVDGHIRVIDWKTCKSYRYIKSEDELATDVQGVVYMKHSLEKYKDAATVSFEHCYLSTTAIKGSFRIRRSPILTRAQIDEQWAGIIETVELMKRDAAAATGAALLMNKGEPCSDFGGCPHYRRCHSAAEAYDAWEPAP